MEFIQACKIAEGKGIPTQQFLTVWEQEVKLKQTESELKLQRIKAEAEKIQVRGSCLYQCSNN